jgi:hypothetical protein
MKNIWKKWDGTGKNSLIVVQCTVIEFFFCFFYLAEYWNMAYTNSCP